MQTKCHHEMVSPEMTQKELQGFSFSGIRQAEESKGCIFSPKYEKKLISLTRVEPWTLEERK